MNHHLYLIQDALVLEAVSALGMIYERRSPDMEENDQNNRNAEIYGRNERIQDEQYLCNSQNISSPSMTGNNSHPARETQRNIYERFPSMKGSDSYHYNGENFKVIQFILQLFRYIYFLLCSGYFRY